MTELLIAGSLGSMTLKYWCLGGQLQLLSLQHLGNVEIEEVAVEDGLHAPGHDSNDVVEAFHVVSVDPVENVEGPVGSQCKQVVACDRLGLSGLAHHEELGEDGHALQVDGEGPQDLHHRKLVVQRYGQQGSRAQQKFNPKRVVVAVVGGLELDIHQVDGGGGRAHEEDLHTRVVQGDKVGEKIQVPGDKDGEKEDL